MNELENLYAIVEQTRLTPRASHLVVAPETEVVIADKDRAQTIRSMLAKGYPDEVWKGGMAVTGKGAQKGDFLQRTEAEIKFTVLVEIKKPDTPLLGKEEYRNGAHELGKDLTGGVSQVQANCQKWEKEGSESEENRCNLYSG